jgi:aspartate kinase
MPAPSKGRELAALTERLADMEGILVSGVELELGQGRVTLVGLPDVPGSASKLFKAVAAGGIVVDMIVQNLTAGRPEISFSVPQGDLAKAEKLTREAARQIDASTEVSADGAMAIIHVGGVGMRTHTGVARKMFGALAARGINIAMINTSEVRLSVVVDRARGEEALATLRDVFGLK